MPLQLTSHFVAFIDLLGFSEMVRSDCESSDSPKNLELLHDAHLQASAFLGRDMEAALIQFSDSIVFSRPFDLNVLDQFVSTVATLQKLLLRKGLLCRGGITFGKHFVKDRFLFSKGLIDAYRLENEQARYPRIIMSDNLLQLASSVVNVATFRILKEDDGLVFVDYLFSDSTKEKTELELAVRSILDNSPTGSASVQEKMRWLARYTDYKMGTNLSIPKFTAL